MIQDPIVKLGPRDCDLLNSFLIPFEELRFMEPNCDEADPKFLEQGKEPHAVFKNDGRSIYRAVYNRMPVIVKEVQLKTQGKPGELLPNFFTPESQFSLTQLRQLREVIVGLTLPRHGNLCQVIAWARSPKPNHFLIITERFDDDLDNYMARIYKAMTGNGVKCSPADGGPLGWEQFFRISTDLASALARLAWLARGSDPRSSTLDFRKDYVVHRDLKLANLFLVLHETLAADFDNYICRIKAVGLGDFGLARVEDLSIIEQPADYLVTKMVGTLSYQPPEVIDPDSFFSPGGADERLTPKLDMFSYGVILWRLLHYPKILTQEFKQLYRTDAAFQTAVVAGKVTPPCDPAIPEDLKAIIAKCCNGQPSSRPTAEEVRSALLSCAKSMGCSFKAQPVVRTVTTTPNNSISSRVTVAQGVGEEPQLDAATVVVTTPTAQNSSLSSPSEVAAAGGLATRDVSSVQ